MNYKRLSREEERILIERDRVYAAIYFYARLADVPLDDEKKLDRARRAARKSVVRARSTPKCHSQDTLLLRLP